MGLKGQKKKTKQREGFKTLKIKDKDSIFGEKKKKSNLSGTRNSIPNMNSRTLIRKRKPKIRTQQIEPRIQSKICIMNYL